MMKKCFTALKNGTWEEYKETSKDKMRASERAFDRIKEVANYEAEKVSIVQEIMLKSTDYVSSRQLEDKEESQCLTCTRIATVSPLEDHIWWVSGKKKTTKWWCAVCGEKYDWRQPNRLLVVQTDDSIEQAKVFKAHAIPQGLSANLINALKLLENQQDGDGLFQNIVKKSGKELEFISTYRKKNHFQFHL